MDKKNKIKLTIGLVAIVLLVGFGAINMNMSATDSYPTNIVAYWKLDEAIGSTAHDETSNHNDGILSGGKFGNALEFNGIDDYVDVPDSASLDITTAITVEAWVKADTWDNYYSSSTLNVCNILDKGEHQTAQAYDLYSYQGALHFRINKQSQGASSTGLPSIGVWHHIAGTYDGIDIKLFVDGVQVGIRNQEGPVKTNTYPLYIGNGVDRQYYFNGLIDEVRISNLVRYVGTFRPRQAHL